MALRGTKNLLFPEYTGQQVLCYTEQHKILLYHNISFPNNKDMFITILFTDKLSSLKKRLLKTPDIVFEVVSETTVEKDKRLKKELYERER